MSVPYNPDMSQADYVWGAIIASGVAFEAHALRNARDGDTLSELTRSVFRTRASRVGRYAFLGVWLGFAAWFTGHIMEWWA